MALLLKTITNEFYKTFQCLGEPDKVYSDNYGTYALYHYDKILQGERLPDNITIKTSNSKFGNLVLSIDYTSSSQTAKEIITFQRESYDDNIESVNNSIQLLSTSINTYFVIFELPYYNKLACGIWGRFTQFDPDTIGNYNPENGTVYFRFKIDGGNFVDGINYNEDWVLTNLDSKTVFNPDPLSGGGISGVGGTGSGGTGGGNWSAPSDNINFPTTPTVPDIMQTGIFSAYAMTTAELQTFGNYLWNGDFFDIIQKLASDPLDSIIGLSVFPFDLSTVASESVPLKVGNATVNDLQTVSKLKTNMKTISCGSINISHYSGNAMDYAPYTKLQIYLPYIGIRDLNINDFMNSVIKVDYAIDILTGSCCAYISTVNDGVNKVLYTFTGKMSADIPISGRNYATLIGSISTLATTGAVASTLGGALPIAGATLLSASKMVANSQPQVEHSGNFDSHLSLNLLQTPYLIITRPRQSLPQSFNSFKGYPSNITERLGNLNGYTEVEYVHMDGFPNATKEEILEIETLLKSGVIL